MFFKGKTKIRFIQVYFHATTTANRQEIADIYRYVLNLITTAHDKNTKVILMGDFNISPEIYKKEYATKGSFHWRFKILHKLQDNNMIDRIDFTNDITDSNDSSQHTFWPNQPSVSSSRIDMIYVSHSLLPEIITCDRQSPDLFDTDHDAVFTIMSDDIFNIQSTAQRKKKK